MLTQKEYILELQRRGYDISDLEAVKAEYRKKYQQAIRQTYKKVRKRKELAFSLEEYEILEKAAKSAGVRTGPFAVQCILKALGSNLVFVRQDASLDAIVSATHKLGNLLNQWLRIAYSTKSIHASHIETCQIQLRKLLIDARAHFQKPIDVEKAIADALVQNPRRVHSIARILISHLAK